MSWNVLYLKEALDDLKRLDGSQRILVLKAIAKVSQNPLPDSEGGYGKPLHGSLSGLMKIKLRASGLRVVYQIIRQDEQMLIVVIGARADNEVYETAQDRFNHP